MGECAAAPIVNLHAFLVGMVHQCLEERSLLRVGSGRFVNHDPKFGNSLSVDIDKEIEDLPAIGASCSEGTF